MKKNPNAGLHCVGRSGTRDSHWRESVFRNELMTGFISAVPNPLSAMTAASLLDLGYITNAGAAAAYFLGSSLRVQGSDLDQPVRDEVLRPLYRVDRTGTVRPISF